MAAMDRILVDYFAAWNETDAGERERLLEQSLSDDAELRPLIGVLANERRSDTLVVITGAAAADDIAVLGALARRFDDSVIGVVCPAPQSVVPGRPPGPIPAGMAG